MQDRLEKGRERLDQAREVFALLSEPVPPPKGELEHIHYFCGNTEKPDDLAEREPLRTALCKAVAALVRAPAFPRFGMSSDTWSRLSNIGSQH